MKQFHIGLVPNFRPQPSESDGISVYSLSLITALSRIDSPFRYSVFIAPDHRAMLQHISHNIQFVTVKPITTNLIIDNSWYFCRLPLYAKQKGIDLLHLFAGNRRLSLFPFSKTVVTVHDLYHITNRHLYTTPRFLFCRYILLPLLKRLPHLIAVSQATAQEMQKTHGIASNRICVAPNGVRSGFFQCDDAANQSAQLRKKYQLENDYMLYVSTLDHPRKNHLNLMKAYKHLKLNGNFHLDLVFAGTPFWQSEIIYAEREILGLNESVRILPMVPDRDLPRLYQQARIFVHPSRHEGFGMPLLEAMASKVPVACSSIPAFREIGGDAALYFNPDDPVDIAHKIELIYTNKTLQEQLRCKGIERARQYHWDACAAKVVEAYRTILNTH